MSDMDQLEQHQHANLGMEEEQPQANLNQNQNAGGDDRTEQEKATDKKLAERLSALIEDANAKCAPICKMIRKVRNPICAAVFFR